MVAPNSNNAQHQDPVSWDRLIEDLGPASCIVVHRRD